MLTTGGACRSSDETVSVRWVDPSRALDMMAPTFAVRVRDALAGNDVRTRVHDGRVLLN